MKMVATVVLEKVVENMCNCSGQRVKDGTRKVGGKIEKIK